MIWSLVERKSIRSWEPEGGKGGRENKAYVAKMVPVAGKGVNVGWPSSASAQILGCIISRSDQRKSFRWVTHLKGCSAHP